MRYSYNWLKELSGTKKSPKQLAEILMMHAFEVEEVWQFPHHLENVVVGKIMKLEKHPNADKLRVAEVAVGKKDTRRIVCGAWNAAVGQKVAVALPGAKLSVSSTGETLEIKNAVLRGVESQGMLCSARELGLGNNHDGILVLEKDAAVGTPFAKYAGLEDSILEIKILPDRGSDALSYRGMAREIAALGNHQPRFVEKLSEPLKTPTNNRAPKIVVQNNQACRRYFGIVFNDVTAEESPLWLKAKLILSGLRSVSNIVDITNYLMLLTGQPLHVFDADKLSGAITIRRAQSKERLTLLTGETKTLSAEDLVIADDKQVLALAGVMGGEYATVTKETKNIFLEIANFDAVSIRRSKVRHNLPTDASYRFERGLDPNLLDEVTGEAYALITALAFGKCGGVKDIYPRKVKDWKITLSFTRVKNVLGAKIPPSEAEKYLRLLGLAVKKTAQGKSLEVTVSTRRPDLRDEWDLIEEIGRLYGYDRIAPKQPRVSLAPSAKNILKTFEYAVKKYLTHSGFDELLTYSFYGERDQSAAHLPLDKHLTLINPMNPEQKLLRMTLVPAILRKVGENLRHFNRFDIFELGSVFAHGDKKPIKEKKSLLITTVRAKKSDQGNTVSKADATFFSLKEKMLALFAEFHIQDIAFVPLNKFGDMPEAAVFHPTRSAIVRSGDKVLGILGELHPFMARNFGIDARVVLAEFDVASLAEARKAEILFRPLSKFPFATRDISLIFPRLPEGKQSAAKDVTVAEVETLLLEAGAPLLKKYELFDVYEKGDEKSLAFHLSFGADDRTLSGEEMDRTFDRIVALAKKRFMASLRL